MPRIRCAGLFSEHPNATLTMHGSTAVSSPQLRLSRQCNRTALSSEPPGGHDRHSPRRDYAFQAEHEADRSWQSSHRNGLAKRVPEPKRMSARARNGLRPSPTRGQIPGIPVEPVAARQCPDAIQRANSIAETYQIESHEMEMRSGPELHAPIR